MKIFAHIWSCTNMNFNKKRKKEFPNHDSECGFIERSVHKPFHDLYSGKDDGSCMSGLIDGSCKWLQFAIVTSAKSDVCD